MQVPDFITVGNHVYTVRRKRIKAPAGRFIWGQTYAQKTRIDVDDAVSPSQVRDTMLHEVMHAVLRDAPRLIDDDEEEAVIRALTPGLLGVLRSNPDLVKFLLED